MLLPNETITQTIEKQTRRGHRIDKDAWERVRKQKQEEHGSRKRYALSWERDGGGERERGWNKKENGETSEKIKKKCMEIEK